MGKAAAWILVLTGVGWAQFGPKQTLFRDSVKGWTGTLEIHGVGSGTVDGPAPGISAQYNSDQQVKGNLKLDQYDPQTGAWTGALDGTIKVSETSVLSFGCTVTNTLTAATSAQTDWLGKPLKWNLSFDQGSDTWSLWPSNDRVSGVAKSDQSCAGLTQSSSAAQPLGFSPISFKMGFPFPETGFNLVGTSKYTCSGCGNADSNPVVYTFTYNLTATVDQLELVVEPQDYEAWRPQAAMTEDAPGNTLAAKATLQHVDGSALKDTDRLTKITFQLQNVSHQPGVAANFPLKDAKATADLQFTSDSNPDLTVSGDEKNKAETGPGKLYTEATATVTSFDWGAWGELRVTGTLPDGSQIVGHLKGDNAQQNVRLPKRQSNSYIADSWKQDKGVTDKPDNDDSEEEPVGLPKCQGDGLTLYEEYRGFYENGTHIEGNPQKKDFFIRNLVGAEAEAGIWLFTDLSGLEVHKDLTDAEFDKYPGNRLINGNKDDKTPHVVDQHGVLIATCQDQNGGETYGSQAGVRFRPGLVLGICMQGRYQAGRSLTKQYSLSAVDLATGYDRAVAHELFHSVGVEHHGEADKGSILVYIRGPQSTEKPSPVPSLSWGDTPITILDENTGKDLAADWYAAVLASVGNRPLYWGQWSQDMYVAQVSRQHSGDDQCVMRYMFAQLYPAGGDEDLTFYFVPPGTEPAGLQLCNTSDGTGINAPDRKPRPRYLGAAPDRGNCKAWVCVNDNVPPDKN